ncbi:D-alanyl-D-alanine carboxypeptidase [Streptomyces sp. NPDC048664]|uniref:D-alanyl-D-alanine carboxypeptidase n=1 Tax=Streptomyces sp. NPDC048664 TaxID=3154505 RepID=UPI00342B4A71
MAGESPDKSKRRGSSEEPTPGSDAAVPGPAKAGSDPRLVMAGEKVYVDQATAVFSTRGLRGGTGVAVDEGDGTASADTEADTDVESGAAGRESAGEADSDGVTGAADGKDEAEDTADGAPEPKHDPKADAEPESADADADADADAGAGADAETETKTEAEAAPGAKEAPEAETDAEGGDEADEASAPETEAEQDDEEAESAVDQPTAVFTTRRPAVDQPTTMLKLGGAKPSKPAASDDTAKDTADATDEAETGAEPSDEPADKPAVDQPTTMLKLGGGKSAPAWAAKSPASADAKKADAKDDEAKKDDAKGADAEPAAPAQSDESGVERTSKFVALKPLDGPKSPKAKPEWPAADKARTGPKPQPKAESAPAPAEATTALPQVGPERTAQQPLPPKPPLDLLAELTNTPPPPETPVRTAVRRVKIWTPLVVLLAIVFAVVQNVRPLPAPTLALTAQESYQFDGGQLKLPWPSEGQGWMDGDGIGVMDQFGQQKAVPIGSVAKTMTAYIVLKDHPLKPGEEGPKITIDPTAEKEGGYSSAGESTVSVKAGEKLSLKQALSAVMIPSANNIARLLARWDAGSEAAFVKKMNATAKGLGMTDTTYTDPSGLKETTISSARDQVKLGHEVVQNAALVAITSAASWDSPSGKNYPNVNTLPYEIGAIGIKTGSTTAAGGNLLFAARKKVGSETVVVVGAILGQHTPSVIETVNRVSKTALLAAKGALTSKKIMNKGDVVGYVDDGLGGHTPVVVTEDVSAVGWAGLKVKLSLAAADVPHTAKAGTKVGALTVGDGRDGAVRVPVALQKDLAEPGFGSKVTRIG